MDASSSAGASSKGKKAAAQAAANLPHVLVVDDDAICRLMHTKLFQTHSCKVTEVDSGLKALVSLGIVEDQQSSKKDTKIEKVHLVCTDYNMPGMTGYELLQIIKKSSKTKDVPVVIVSSDAGTTRVNECLEAGARMFLSKPLQSEDVQKLLNLL